MKKLVKSPAFKEVVRLVAALLAGYAASACAGLPPHRALSVAECKARVLAPYVGDAAGEVARAIDGRAMDPIAFLMAQGLTVREVLDVAKAYSACELPDEPEPAPAPLPPRDKA